MSSAGQSHISNSGVPSLPPPIFSLRCTVCWIVLAMILLIVVSFASLDMQFGRLFSVEAAQRMGKFVGELLSPSVDAAFLKRLGIASLETLAMSALGTLLALIMGLLLAVPASRKYAGERTLIRGPMRLTLNFLRSIPELVWAALLLISAGLGPLAGTLALALHTTGVLGRLFAEAIENAPAGPGSALRTHGVPEGRVFLYASLPQILPQILSYTLYRWENNIRAAAVLGVVGGGGLGQMLAFHMGLFQMRETSSVLIAMLMLVAMVDMLSYVTRRVLGR